MHGNKRVTFVKDRITVRYLIVCFLFLWYACLLAQPVAGKKMYQGTAFKTLAVPVLLSGYGLLCMGGHGLPSDLEVRSWRNTHLGMFHTSADDYMVFVPAAAVYGLDLLKVESKNDPLNQTILFAKTSLLAFAMVYGLKYTTNVTRPDASDQYSFPSAHTAFAFAYATVLHEEFKDKSPWISVAGYTVAAATGASRIANNKHWYSDVFVGAGLGVLSTKLVYLTHQHKYHWDWQTNSSVLPIIGNQQYGLLWQKKF